MSVDLYWLPLGAGGHSVRWNGRVYEAVVAWRAHRQARDIYHAALEVRVADDRYVIEVGPAWASAAPPESVVCDGPVGARPLGRSRLFRYEVRCWRDGVIADIAEAVASPVRVSEDVWRARRVLDLAPSVPAYTWGRDGARAGDMWNSNSVVSWLLARSGHDVDAIVPPPDGTAPGWDAGLVEACVRT